MKAILIISVLVFVSVNGLAQMESNKSATAPENSEQLFFSQTNYQIVLDQIVELRSTFKFQGINGIPDYPTVIGFESFTTYLKELNMLLGNSKQTPLELNSDEEKYRLVEFQTIEEILQLKLLNAESIPTKPSPINLTYLTSYLENLKKLKTELILNTER